MTAAFVFPGQGSQSVGMLSDFANHASVVQQTFDEASERLGFDLWDIVSAGPRERLDETIVTQPAMLAAGVATWRCWVESGGLMPQQFAGHSLGEYTALVCGGVLNFGDAVELVQKRAAAMQSAVPAGVGAMAAILGLSDDQVEHACAQCQTDGEVVEPVNYNAPGQVVIAGHAAAVERAIAAARAAGARRAVLLPVSVPSHSSLMEVAAKALAEPVGAVTMSDPTIAVISSVDALTYRDADHVRTNLLAQVHRPVRWVATVQAMVGAGSRHIVECGPGKVLTGLNRRITKGHDVTTHAIMDSESLAATQNALEEVS